VVRHAQLYDALSLLHRLEGLEPGPFACAGFPGLQMIALTEEDLIRLQARGSTGPFRNATHVLWTTGGGSLAPGGRAAG
jgi:D-serine dehydratase